jgi:hypothetical protein
MLAALEESLYPLWRNDSPIAIAFGLVGSTDFCAPARFRG